MASHEHERLVERAFFPIFCLSALPLNFCNKKQEIEVGTWVAGIARFAVLFFSLKRISLTITGSDSEEMINPFELLIRSLARTVLEIITGSPASMASRTTMPKVSYFEGMIKISEAR